jgi:hypothetical protein
MLLLFLGRAELQRLLSIGMRLDSDDSSFNPVSEPRFSGDLEGDLFTCFFIYKNTNYANSWPFLILPNSYNLFSLLSISTLSLHRFS